MYVNKVDKNKTKRDNDKGDEGERKVEGQGRKRKRGDVTPGPPPKKGRVEMVADWWHPRLS
ncbi:hypothetical protein N7G274_000069 [Stereocaulon virgatum]|uniref:Uncharacterized protein n=1 Tax=Stereocaulon virgatum TaxID=373712 RepID=A0ABR4AXG8_9LECA